MTFDIFTLSGISSPRHEEHSQSQENNIMSKIISHQCVLFWAKEMPESPHHALGAKELARLFELNECTVPRNLLRGPSNPVLSGGILHWMKKLNLRSFGCCSTHFMKRKR
jgi:predicted Rossmann-fold nucleotide-binding protein